MPRVAFTPNLERHIDVPPKDVVAATVAEALAAVFADNPRLRHYLLDDQGRLRKHVNVFVNSEPVADRDSLTDPVSGTDEVFVFQALSGGSPEKVSGGSPEKVSGGSPEKVSGGSPEKVCGG